MKNHQNTMALLLLAASYFVLTGFSLPGKLLGNAESEVEDFIGESKRNLKASHNVDLPPLPQIKKYKAYEYQAGNEDPFKLRPFVTDVVDDKMKNEALSQSCTSADCGDSAPIFHVPYFLEAYDINKLSMTGTMIGPKGRVIALIKTPKSGIQELREGEYVGRNNGLVLSIHPDHIVVQEKYKVPRGWQNRMAILELFNLN